MNGVHRRSARKRTNWDYSRHVALYLPTRRQWTFWRGAVKRNTSPSGDNPDTTTQHRSSVSILRRTQPFPSTHASFAVRARPSEPFRSATTPPASAHRLCLPSILRLLVCFAADRIRPLRQPIREVVHRATRLASSPQTLYARVRLYSRSTDRSVRLRLRLSFPARSCLPH